MGRTLQRAVVAGQRLRAILVNPAYAGDMVWNRRTDARFHRIERGRTVERAVTGRRLEHNDAGSWVTARDAHEPLVPRRTWEAAQAHLGRKPDSAAQRGTDPRQRGIGAWGGGPRAKFLLSGLITCGRCGSRYEGITQRVRTRDAQGNKNKSYFYACGGAVRHGPTVCSFGQIARDAFERAVVAAVLGHCARHAGPAGLRRLEAAARAGLGRRRDAAVAAQRSLRARVAAVDATVRNLLDNITPANRAFADVRLAELAADRDWAEAELVAVAGAAVSDGQLRQAAADAHAFLAGLPAVLADGDDDAGARGAALRRCVTGVDLAADGRSARVGLAGTGVRAATGRAGRDPRPLVRF